MTKEHHYTSQLQWTGNLGNGTADYKSYSRNFLLTAAGKIEIPGSSDPAFRGDSKRYNPEEMLVGALSSCHMLWYLHLCAVNGVVVLEYHDQASGKMAEHADGSGEFTEVTLNPIVKVKDPATNAKALSLHAEAHKFCFIARSINFPLHHNPSIIN